MMAVDVLSPGTLAATPASVRSREMDFLGFQGPEVKSVFWDMFECVGLVLTLGPNFLYPSVPLNLFFFLLALNRRLPVAPLCP